MWLHRLWLVINEKGPFNTRNCQFCSTFRTKEAMIYFVSQTFSPWIFSYGYWQITKRIDIFLNEFLNKLFLRNKLIYKLIWFQLLMPLLFSFHTHVDIYIYIVIDRQICFVLSKLINVARQNSSVWLYIYIYIYIVYHKSEYTPHIFAGI